MASGKNHMTIEQLRIGRLHAWDDLRNAERELACIERGPHAPEDWKAARNAVNGNQAKLKAFDDFIHQRENGS